VPFTEVLQVRSEVLTVATVKITVFWDVMACPFEDEGNRFLQTIRKLLPDSTASYQMTVMFKVFVEL
jgi:hypothetical protein